MNINLVAANGMRQFRIRGLAQVSSEFTLATLACNMTRLYTMLAG